VLSAMGRRGGDITGGAGPMTQLEVLRYRLQAHPGACGKCRPIGQQLVQFRFKAMPQLGVIGCIHPALRVRKPNDGVKGDRNSE
jgi:hypothetical protein